MTSAYETGLATSGSHAANTTVSDVGRTTGGLRGMSYDAATAHLRPSPDVPAATPVEPLLHYPAYNRAHHNAHDAMIRRVVSAFNTAKGWDPTHPHYLDPNLVKAWALQESGGHRDIFSSGDMMQMNNPGDWANDKSRYLGMQKTDDLTPEQSLSHALHWAYYKGETTKQLGANGQLDGPEWYPTSRGSEGVAVAGYQSRFLGWERALTQYNGGGVADYYGDISAIHSTGRVPGGY